MCTERRDATVETRRIAPLPPNMVRLHKEIEHLKKELLALGAIVEERVAMAVKSLSKRDIALAQRVIDGDNEIDEMEVDLEEDCLKILALHQPVAIDLRVIIAVLKINNDLERIGDLALAIAERALDLSAVPEIPLPFDFQGMSSRVQEMLRNSLDALVNWDFNLANQVCAVDDEVDENNRAMYRNVRMEMARHPEQIDQLLGCVSISRQLERIADHATNIAEDVIYLINGAIVRHQSDVKGK